VLRYKILQQSYFIYNVQNGEKRTKIVLHLKNSSKNGAQCFYYPQCSSKLIKITNVKTATFAHAIVCSVQKFHPNFSVAGDKSYTLIIMVIR